MQCGSPSTPGSRSPHLRGRRDKGKPAADVASSRDAAAGVSDVAQLLTLTEESVMQNTMVRFSRDEIYTFVGSVLLAVNPYKVIPALFGEAAMEAFQHISMLEAPPHIYALIEGAYRKAVNGGGNQCLIISGESGAGKTESTKHALSYLVWRMRFATSVGATGASSSSSSPDSSDGTSASGARLTTSILQANPLLEAFGNACTSRNSNSSRFGKCVRLTLDAERGYLLGGQVETYLLEKSRVTSGMADHFASGERNFHSFYQLIAGVAEAQAAGHKVGGGGGGGLLGFLRLGANEQDELSPHALVGFDALGLTGSPRDYRLLGQFGAAADAHHSAAAKARGLDDAAAFRKTCAALCDLGCSRDEIRSLFSLLAALLHLGNGEFEDDASGIARPSPGLGAAALAAASRALRCPQLADLLLHRSLKVGGEMMRIDLRAEQADNLLRGILKSLYTLGFGWILRRVNSVLRAGGAEPTAPSRASAGVVVLDILDIFGFENFASNSFEQLCINFANEKLHQLFLKTMFKAEEAVVARERLTLPPIEYCDNQRCLAMLEDAPRGIFHVLDTCCRVHASAASFCLQVHAWHAECEFLVLSMNGANEDRTFTVRHFAGDVCYHVDEFSSKNTETMESQTRQVLDAEGLALLRPIFDDEGDAAAPAPSADDPIGGSGQPRDANGHGSGGLSFGAAAAAAAAVAASTGLRRAPSTAGVERGEAGRMASSTGKRFLRDMGRLMASLLASSSHFVHCVKPNGMEQPELLSYEMVAEQLTSLGTLETVQLMGLGYPVRIKYEQLRRRFLPRLANIPGAALLSPKLFVEMILEVCDTPPGDYKLGVTRLFLRHRAAQVLESLEPLDVSVLEPLVRSKVDAFWQAASRIRDALLTYYHQKRFRAFWKCVRIAQKYLRMWLALRRFKRMVSSAGIIQHASRSHRVRLACQERRARRGAAIRIQKHLRGWVAMREYLRVLDAASTIQAAYWLKHPPPQADSAAEGLVTSARVPNLFSDILSKLGWNQPQEGTRDESASLLLRQLANKPGGALPANEPQRQPLASFFDFMFRPPPRAEEDASAVRSVPPKEGVPSGHPYPGVDISVGGLPVLAPPPPAKSPKNGSSRLGLHAADGRGCALTEALSEPSVREGALRPRSPEDDDAGGSSASGLSASMPVGWRRFSSLDGRPYFFNPNTNATQWEPPILRYEMTDEEGLPCYYFYDPLTRRTSWIEPESIRGWQLPERQQRQLRVGASIAAGLGTQAAGRSAPTAAMTAGGAWPNVESGEEDYEDADLLSPGYATDEVHKMAPESDHAGYPFSDSTHDETSDFFLSPQPTSAHGAPPTVAIAPQPIRAAQLQLPRAAFATAAEAVYSAVYSEDEDALKGVTIKDLGTGRTITIEDLEREYPPLKSNPHSAGARAADAGAGVGIPKLSAREKMARVAQQQEISEQMRHQPQPHQQQKQHGQLHGQQHGQQLQRQREQPQAARVCSTQRSTGSARVVSSASDQHRWIERRPEHRWIERAEQMELDGYPDDAEAEAYNHRKLPQHYKPLSIKDLDTGRTIAFEHADMLWQPLLVRDLDANILLPLAPCEGRSSIAEEMLNPPPAQMKFMSCSLERTTLPPPLSLPEYRLFKVSRKRKVEMFSACRRQGDTGITHFDVRWMDGVLSFTGRLQLLPPSAGSHLQELAMYDDYINYYGFPRELGFIRTKQLLNLGETGALIELIIPRVSPDGAAAQFRVNAVPGQSMLTMYKQRRAREHMFVLRGRLSILDSRALVELRHRDEKGRLNVVLQAKRMRSSKGEAQPWRVGFAHPLSAFQTFCVLLALHTDH